MVKGLVDVLKSLHTHAIDARNGYAKANEDNGENALRSLFGDMITLHTKNADELAVELSKAGERPDDGGSFMSTVHRAIMNVRSMFDALDESVLPGLIDGETRNITSYTEALEGSSLQSAMHSLLVAQRETLRQAIIRMQSHHG